MTQNSQSNDPKTSKVIDSNNTPWLYYGGSIAFILLGIYFLSVKDYTFGAIFLALSTGFSGSIQTAPMAFRVISVLSLLVALVIFGLVIFNLIPNV